MSWGSGVAGVGFEVVRELTTQPLIRDIVVFSMLIIS